MTLTIKLDGNWSSFQLANSAPPLCVTDSAIAPSARMMGVWLVGVQGLRSVFVVPMFGDEAIAPRATLCRLGQLGQRLGHVTPKGVLLPALCRASATREDL